MSMAKRRTLHPGLWRNERLLELPIPVFLTAIGLHMYADDEGRASATSSLIKADLYPTRQEMTPAVIDEHLLQLDEAGVITLYTLDERRTAYACTEWCKQNNPADSKIPPPPEGAATEYVDDTYSIPVEERESEGESEGAEGARYGSAVPPSPFCKAHPTGTAARCRNCGTARLRNRHWHDLRTLSEDAS